ncbi:hypothetical protein [Polynucleobacter tropicus]|uniref:hypothetical protein n=1 Tax=Polynucleobacter tropicus TaxID=1743174 RepID=UPI00156E73E3|nr:hypothetical protein [Polynucleobacter tropicus]
MQPSRLKSPNGFILLEVLVAISLISGVWLASIGHYHGLAMRFHQLEIRRAQLRLDFDLYERVEQYKAGDNQASKEQVATPSVSKNGLKHESSGMSHRNRAQRSITQSATPGKR